MITLQSYPSAASNHFAVGNPLYYTFHSNVKGGGAFRSYEFTAAFINETKIRVNSSYLGVERTGDAIAITINGTTEIRNIISISAGGGFYRINIDGSAFAYTEEPEIKTVNNYRIQLKLFHGQKEVQGSNLVMQQVGGISEITPDIHGSARFDVQKYLKPFVDYQKTLLEAKKNTIDNGCWGRFYVQYREKFDGDGQEDNDNWTPEANPSVMRWWLAGAKQLKSVGGVSMSPYVRYTVEFPEGFITIGKILTAFTEPEYYAGYPNEASFFWVRQAELYYLNFLEQDKTINKVNDGVVRKTELLSEGYEALNRVVLNTDKTKGFLEIGIEINEEAEENYVAPGYVNVGYFETL